jgi:hypothetical protein
MFKKPIKLKHVLIKHDHQDVLRPSLQIPTRQQSNSICKRHEESDEPRAELLPLVFPDNQNFSHR